MELLVVVIIIGILAAIALPQYKYAVLKSRYSTLKQNATVIFSAMQRYYLINDQYPAELSYLDIEINDTNSEYYRNGNCINAYNKKYSTLVYRVCSNHILCSFSSSNESIFDKLDNFCKKETNGGNRYCNSETNCYYYYKN